MGHPFTAGWDIDLRLPRGFNPNKLDKCYDETDLECGTTTGGRTVFGEIMKYITLILALILIEFLSVYADDLIPKDVEVGNKGDAIREEQRRQDSASVETISPDWKPWVLTLRQSSTNNINPVLTGYPINLHVRTSGDSVFFMLIRNVGINKITWPKDKFHLFIQYGNDYACYEVEIHTDSLVIQTIRSSWFVEMKSEMKPLENMVFLQLEDNVPKLKGDAKKLFEELEKIAEYIVLDQGYYKGFPEEVKKGRKKRKTKPYNYTDSGRLLALKVSSESRDSFSAAINDYSSRTGTKIQKFLMSR
jgi:hypothetical protein